MSFNIPIPCIGYAVGIAAADPSCCVGPIVLQPNFLLPEYDWLEILYAPASGPRLEAIDAIATVNARLAGYTGGCVVEKEPFIVFGGDHSSAIGTWSGVADALSDQGDIGLIWIDAHMDSHTPETTVTENIHGMPLAALLGCGDKRLTQIVNPKPKLNPKRVCLIGVRDYEEPEAQLLKSLGVKVFSMEDVRQQGIDTILQQALMYVKHKTAGYGISFDIDAIDPKDAPGTGLRVPNGILAQPFVESLQLVRGDKSFLGLEIAEFNPNYDEEKKTERLIEAVVTTIFGEEIPKNPISEISHDQ